MRFVKLTEEGNLWSVHYDEDDENVFSLLFSRWKHPSWLRLYALKFGEEGFLITGGAIKLTQLMADRGHTNRELIRLERVRSFLV